GKLGAVLGAHEQYFRMALAQFLDHRPIADDHLTAGQIEIEESADILLDRDATDISIERPRQIHRRRRKAREIITTMEAEQFGVDATRPAADTIESSLAQLCLDRGRRDHHRG